MTASSQIAKPFVYRNLTSSYYITVTFRLPEGNPSSATRVRAKLTLAGYVKNKHIIESAKEGSMACVD